MLRDLAATVASTTFQLGWLVGFVFAAWLFASRRCDHCGRHPYT